MQKMKKLEEDRASDLEQWLPKIQDDLRKAANTCNALDNSHRLCELDIVRPI